MTDKEIIQALECCCEAELNEDCKKLKCPFFDYELDNCTNMGDMEAMYRVALDLINRKDQENESLKAEVERLNFVRTRDAQRYDKKTSDQAHTNCILIDLHSNAIKEVKELEEKLKTANAEIEELTQKYAWKHKEYMNYRKKHSLLKAEAYKEFAERVIQTLAMFNAQEIAGVSKEYDNRYFCENPMAWKEGSTTARNEAISIIHNLLNELVGEDK